jgi:hypothetical protein
MKGERRLVFDIPAALASASFFLYQEPPSSPSTLLLREIILMLVIRPGVLAAERAKLCSSARKTRLANDAGSFHMIFKNGLQVYHITKLGFVFRYACRTCQIRGSLKG